MTTAIALAQDAAMQSTAATDNVIVVDFATASTPVSDLAKRLAAEATDKIAERKQGGLKHLAVGRSDIYRVSPYVLTIKEGWNCREMADPENLAHIDMLARSIAEIGVKEPLTVYWDKETGVSYVSDGHCRLLATFRAIEVYGAEIKTIPVKHEPTGSSAADRVLSQIVRNAGKTPSPYEQGRAFSKLVGFGWTQTEIAAKAGVTVVTVARNLKLYEEMPPEMAKLIAEGKVKSNFAAKTLRESGSVEEAEATLTQAVQTAAAQGRTRAMPKHTANGGKKRDDKGDMVNREVVATLLHNASVEKKADGTVTVTFDAKSYAKLAEMLGL